MQKPHPRLAPLISLYNHLSRSRAARMALLADVQLGRRITGQDAVYSWLYESTSALGVLCDDPRLLADLDANRRLLDIMLSRSALEEATQAAIWRAFSRASSMVPTMYRVCSGRSS